MRQPGEPTIEEILDSIKRVIAREDRAAALAAPHPGDTQDDGEGEEGDDDADVLDLARHDYAATGADASPLVTASASNSMRGALEALAGVAASAPPAPPQRGSSGSSLEAIVLELLRPALADWLDRNLPRIVERMVAEEIARITGRRG